MIDTKQLNTGMKMTVMDVRHEIYSGLFSPERNKYPVKCVHEQITGKPCPSCGLSHSFSYIIRGNFKSANDWNTYGMRVFLFFLLQLLMRISGIIVLLRNRLVPKNMIFADIGISLIAFGLSFSQFVSYYFSALLN